MNSEQPPGGQWEYPSQPDGPYGRAPSQRGPYGQEPPADPYPAQRWRPPPPLRKSWPRRHKIWSAVLTTIGVLVVIGIVGAIFSPPKSKPTAGVSSLSASTKVSSSPATSPAPVLSLDPLKPLSGSSVSAQVTALISPVDGCTCQVQPVGRHNTGLTWMDACRLSRSSVDSGLGSFTP